MCFYDYEPWEFVRTTSPRARKQHVCCECGGPIPVGTLHRLNAGKADGAFSVLRYHIECEALWDFVHKELCDGEGAIIIGCLCEEIAEYHGGSRDDDEEDAAPDEPTLMGILDAIRDGYQRASEMGERR